MQSSMYLLQREADFVKAGEESFQTHLKYLHALENSDNDHIAESSLNKDIQELEQEAEKIRKEIALVDAERAAIQSKRGVVSKELLKKRQLRDAMVDRFNLLLIENTNAHEQLHSLEEETIRTIANLERYKQINTMNDAFYIWYVGPYATINSFRLGNLTNKPIEFTEINAALGQAALVIQIIANRAGVELKHFFISPMGSFPKIIRGDDKKTSYPLFIDSSSFTLFPKRNFNLALQGFMSCIQELGDYIANYDPTLSMPFKISVSESKIGELSFVYGNDDEIWTRSLKFMLADIKWIIAWYTKHCCSGVDIGSTVK